MFSSQILQNYCDDKLAVAQNGPWTTRKRQQARFARSKRAIINKQFVSHFAWITHLNQLVHISLHTLCQRHFLLVDFHHHAAQILSLCNHKCPKSKLHNFNLYTAKKTHNTMWKYCWRGFIWTATQQDFVHKLKSLNHL